MMHDVKRIAKVVAVKAMRLFALVPAWEVDAVIAVVVTAGALALYLAVARYQERTGFSFIGNIELRSLDARFEMRGSRQTDLDIVIIGVDEKTLRKTGYPIPRRAYASLVNKLASAGCKVIGFDLDFPTAENNSALDVLNRLKGQAGAHTSPEFMSEIDNQIASSDNDAAFGEAVAKAGNVILGHVFLDSQQKAQSLSSQEAEDYYKLLWDHPFPQTHPYPDGANFSPADAFMRQKGNTVFGVEPNIAKIAERAKSIGYLDTVFDADGTIRRVPLLIYYKDLDFVPPIEIEMLRYLENISIDDSNAFIGQSGVHEIRLGAHAIHPAKDGTALINYAGPYKTYPHYSLADVLTGEVSPATFHNKIVFVGPTAKGMGDMRITPFSTPEAAYMGVEIHANVLDNLLHSENPRRGFLKRGTREETVDLVVILLFGIGGGILFAKTPPLRAGIAALSILGGFAAVAFIVFALFGMWIYVVIPAATVVIDYAAISSYRMIFEEREKRKVRKTFERYVAPGVIKLIEENPEKYFRTGGEMRELTVMFSDIRGFTEISEGLTPDELVHLLNRYLGDMTGVIFESLGTLDKYIGDAIMAFWGSPVPQSDHAYRACETALKMSVALNDLNQRLTHEGKKTLKIGIGINSGQMNVGNMGSEFRFAWTVMGDNVNLASRLEGQTKAYKTMRLITEFTYEEVKDQMVCRQLDVIRVQGKEKPVAIYELMDFVRSKDQYEDLLAHFNAARDAYIRQSWSEAITLFEGLLERYPEDGPSIVLLDRCKEFRVSPPSRDWDGVYTTKKEAVH
ncbi:adenylate/guanylate cyclase [Candidatus Koribacter versatilis Ellin345]|uniref:Adenylate/guanylate cyclase n=1 Tax=Koribacter versatilis (strain Ellin345) TaxID=204669 RepID=Q1IS04_KORVE|nr:adenylate/guanylate cyclase domain-containing protein [Candidatus Koribacter versatilis]ABF40346.1 adenylate/guanylate cyclase [Candidatus Koribacter versatilis Ellin345]